MSKPCDIIWQYNIVDILLEHPQHALLDIDNLLPIRL